MRKITNSSGSAENTYRYYPFGSSLSASETVTNDLKFTEKPFVDGMNCYDFSARYYDPGIARFYALDPIPSGGSPYAYCGNNPILYVDPSGMAAVPALTQYPDDYTPGVGSSSCGGDYDPFRVTDPVYRIFCGDPEPGAGLNWGHTDVNGTTVYYAFYQSRLQDASDAAFNTIGVSGGLAVGVYRFEQAMFSAWVQAGFGRGPMPTLDPGIRMNSFTPTLVTPNGIVEIGTTEPQTVMLDYSMPQLQVFDPSGFLHEEGLISDPTIFYAAIGAAGMMKAASQNIKVNFFSRGNIFKIVALPGFLWAKNRI